MTTTQLSSLVRDPEALLAAMTLAPGIYSRNRLFEWFERGETKAARARAASLRGLARLWLDHDDAELGLVASPATSAGLASFELTLVVPAQAFRRQLSLTSFECSLLWQLLRNASRRCGRALPFELPGEAQQQLDGALARLRQ